jgi:hypothetical protein
MHVGTLFNPGFAFPGRARGVQCEICRLVFVFE